MCIGSIAVLAERWDDGTASAGRLDDGSVVTLAFVSSAQPGDHLLIHLGIPVEVVHPVPARDALAPRAEPNGGPS